MILAIQNLQEYQNLISLLEDNQIVMLHFTATWCGPCQRIKPHIEQLSAQYPNITICSIDVDQSPDLSQLFKIESMPTFKFIRNNQVVFEFTGANSQQLQQTFHHLTSNQSSFN